MVLSQLHRAAAAFACRFVKERRIGAGLSRKQLENQLVGVTGTWTAEVTALCQ